MSEMNRSVGMAEYFISIYSKQMPSVKPQPIFHSLHIGYVGWRNTNLDLVLKSHILEGPDGMNSNQYGLFLVQQSL